MIDKKEFLKDLKIIKKSCLMEQNYDPIKDIAYLVTKYNVEQEMLWRKIQEILGLD